MRPPGDSSKVLSSSAQAAAPFLRWAGSKRWLAQTLRSTVPREFGTYYEPFLGSGTAYFALGVPGERSCLSDILPGLVNCFEQVRDSPKEIHAVISEWDCDSDSYYEIRGLEPTDEVTRAAQFIYLNRLCFNGLYRENQSGKFNVPYGRPRFQRVFTTGDELLGPSSRLRNTHISVADFVDATMSAEAGDLVYLDPPYVAGHRNNGFVDYNARVFSWEDQGRLAKLCDSLSDRGVMAIISNADHDSIRELYDSSYKVQSVSRFSSMSASAGRRGVSHELLITNQPLQRATR